MQNFFLEEIKSENEHILIEGKEITDYAGIITEYTSPNALEKGEAFAKEIKDNFISDFEKNEAAVKLGLAASPDLMCHVSTYAVINDVIYMTYYANTQSDKEDPNFQTARFVFCPVSNTDNKTYIDIQTVGDTCGGKKVTLVYDTILMPRDEDTLYILWTARLDDLYYRLYRTYTISSGELGEVKINRFKVGNVINDFSTSGIKNALAANSIGYKTMYSDIGVMQKLSKRVENGVTYYYSGTYSGDFNAIIKSSDFETWEYVAQPDFINLSKWENATYVLGDKCYYFVRQHDETPYGFLTAYDLVTKTWDKPVLLDDCQSRSDFIVYNGKLYLFHAPNNRNTIGAIEVDTENLANSKVVFQAAMNSSCFYPFVQYANGDTSAIYFSYTISRQHIRLSKFNPENYFN